MKEIHDTSFTFVPANCVTSLHDTLATPVPAHLIARLAGDGSSEEPPITKPDRASAPSLGNLTKLPPPVSHLLGRDAGGRLSSRGKSILRALQAPFVTGHLHRLSGRETVQQALTDNTYV